MLNIPDAVKLIQDAAKHGYNTDLIINGELYEIKPDTTRDIICYEILKVNKD